MFQKILVPVDGSNTAWKALKTAAVLAEKFDGELVVMTVMEPYDAIGSMSMNLDPEIMASNLGEMKKASMGVLEAAKDKVKEYGFKGKADYVEMDGNPAKLILNKAKKDKCDSIVMGSRGLSGIAEFFLGSVSSKVSQYAEIPVFIVK